MNGWLLRYVHNSIYLSFYLLTLMWMEVSWSFIFRKTFLELSSNTVSQHCPKQLKQMGTWFKKHFFISIQLDRRNLRRSQSDLKRCLVHPFMSLPSLSLLGCELKASCCLRWVLGPGLRVDIFYWSQSGISCPRSRRTSCTERFWISFFFWHFQTSPHSLHLYSRMLQSCFTVRFQKCFVYNKATWISISISIVSYHDWIFIFKWTLSLSEDWEGDVDAQVTIDQSGNASNKYNNNNSNNNLKCMFHLDLIYLFDSFWRQAPKNVTCMYVILCNNKTQHYQSMWELVFLQTLIRATQSFLGICVMSQLLMWLMRSLSHLCPQSSSPWSSRMTELRHL